MNTLFFVVYNILYPVFLFFVFFLSIFNKKIRVGLAGRFESIHILNKYFNQNNIKSNLYWFHCSSYGEYLQVEQIINGLKTKNQSKKFFLPHPSRNPKLIYFSNGVSPCNAPEEVYYIRLQCIINNFSGKVQFCKQNYVLRNTN